jgi:hypothetical protein
LSGGGADALTVSIDLKDLFAMPYGLRLRKNTLDQIKVSVQDDLTNITAFNVIATGFDF